MAAVPNANGLVVAFANESCPRADNVLHKISMSSGSICTAFNSLAYVTCTFNECSKAKFLAVYSVLASKIEYPASYQMLFTHFLGHGHKDFVGVADGFISKNRLKQSFLTSTNSALCQLPKVVFFDCCRSESYISQPERDLPSVENLLVIHSTRLERKAYHVDEEGMGVATSELVKLLKRETPCSFGDMLTELIGVVKERYRKLQSADPNQREEDFSSLWPEYYCNLDKFPNLYEDKLIGSKFYVSAVS